MNVKKKRHLYSPCSTEHCKDDSLDLLQFPWISRHSPLTKSFWTTGKLGMENRCILFARNWSFADFICTTFQESDAPTRSEADSGELGSSNILSSIAAMTSENEVLEQIEQLPGEHCARVQDHRWLTKRLNWQERMILLPHASSKRTNYKINTNQITIKTRMNIMMEMQGLSSFADFSSSSRSFFFHFADFALFLARPRFRLLKTTKSTRCFWEF